jgi:hypothetical protein
MAAEQQAALDVQQQQQQRAAAAAAAASRVNADQMYPAHTCYVQMHIPQGSMLAQVRVLGVKELEVRGVCGVRVRGGWE